MFVNNVSVAILFLFSQPTTADTRVIMICCVLVGKTYQPKELFARSLIVPPSQADTTMGNNGRVYVKYNDYEFYPLYFVYYQPRSEYLINSKYFSRNNRRTQLQLQSLQFLEYMKPNDIGSEKGEVHSDPDFSLDGFDSESL